jgi:hypothetical protein
MNLARAAIVLLLFVEASFAREARYTLRRKGSTAKNEVTKLRGKKKGGTRRILDSEEAIRSRTYEHCGKAGKAGKSGGKGDSRHLNGCSCPDGEESCEEYGDRYDDSIDISDPPTVSPIFDDSDDDRDEGLTPTDPPTPSPIFEVDDLRGQSGSNQSIDGEYDPYVPSGSNDSIDDPSARTGSTEGPASISIGGFGDVDDTPEETPSNDMN